MQNKKYYIISSLIGIFDLIYVYIINVKHLIETEIEYAGNLVNENVLGILNNPAYYYILGLIGILFYLSIMFIIIKKKEVKYKNFLLTANLILLIFFGNNLLLIAIPLVNVYFWCRIPKPTNEEMEKESIPTLDRPQTNIKETIKALSIIIIYFFIHFLLGNIVFSFIKDTNFNNLLFNIITDIFLLILVIILFKDELLSGFKLLIKKFKVYAPYILRNYGLLLLVNIGFSLLIALFMKGFQISQNEIGLSTLPTWYLLPAASIYAPIVEEVVFRGAFRRLIKNDTLFIIISGLCFGLLHTIGQEATIVNTLVFGLPYIGMGIILAYTYKKTNNITTNISIHFLNNFLATILKAL